MTTAHLSRKANGVSKGRHKQTDERVQLKSDLSSRVDEAAPPERVETIEPVVVPAPKARFETPPCIWCKSENTEVYSERKGEVESRSIKDPSGKWRSVDVVGIAKYCRCKRCRHTWKQFFESVRLP